MSQWWLDSLNLILNMDQIEYPTYTSTLHSLILMWFFKEIEYSISLRIHMKLGGLILRYPLNLVLENHTRLGTLNCPEFM